MWPRRAKDRNAPEPERPLAGSVKPTVGPATPPMPQRLRPPKRARLTEDILLGLFGVALGLGSAFFPWYVFFNQEKFGIRAVKLDSDIQSVDGLSSSTPQMPRIADPAEIKEITSLDLDRLPTGTTPQEEPDGQATGSVPAIIEQPYPHHEAEFRVIHIENGRAMIEDDSGLWIVQRGSTLPDMTKVTSIEQRDSGWVVVTSGKRVLAITP